MGVTLFGGAFDPPHVGHVELVRAAKERFDVPQLIVLVSEAPGHKGVSLPAETRLELARAAFPDEDVRLDPYARTVDLLRAEHFDDPLFVIGADEFCDFPTWTEPAAVLGLTRLAVGTRPGFPTEKIDAALDRVSRLDRVLFFEIEPNPAASRDIRGLAEAGESLDSLVPPAVAAIIAERKLYVRSSGLH